MTRLPLTLIIVLSGIIFHDSATAQNRQLQAGSTYYIEVLTEDGLTQRYLFTPASDMEVEVNTRKRNAPVEVTDETLYQDAESLRKYGKLFPGIDGKLYGTSEAELDEMAVTLRNDDSAIPATKDTIRDLYHDLQSKKRNK